MGCVRGAVLAIGVKLVLLTCYTQYVACDRYEYINLPKAHLPLYFRRFPALEKQCVEDENCPYRTIIASQSYQNRKDAAACWGYEEDCTERIRYVNHTCPGSHVGYVKSKKAQLDTFYSQADFGFVRDQIRETRIMCEPQFPHDSSLECSKYLRFCRGRNLMINFTDLAHRTEPLRYKMDVLGQGQIGGHCRLHEKRLRDELQHISPLQSWGPELRFFERLERPPIEDGRCDVVVEKPTFIMKIDAAINMYHHFCDFLNLYASLHVNLSHPASFGTDTHVLIWESFTYLSPFAETFKVFTSNPIADLKTYAGKVVCFRNVMLPLLPRMIFGLYYNTPIIYGCENSGLFHAFSEHVLHRLKVQLTARPDDRIRITFLSRQTRYRRVLNEDELMARIAKNPNYDVQRVSYGHDLPFVEQLRITRNTDVFIGMHGAGLTHLLFLPKWATLFELYHCEDPNCYRDLARLRGVHYLSWERDHLVYPDGEGKHPERDERHAKFTNYAFDVNEFERLVAKAANHVREHQEFRSFLAAKKGKTDRPTKKDEL
ncbi:EGF domain-specific O-linked N-acetylglucosamine transferase [Anopheles maculipalpis]|uniref:EGF domain-specific O-linked N-acetylglucosamine transferase n=1 Tax=Anopheles maculipalpis TaxID=1496333 RepID=UPI0021599930|nr:EGF domain-specific O-linked N-acetylglucosamine transferase [Anopheles maculipalpis]